MARHEFISYIDDIDGSEPARKVFFGYRGREYEIDLSDEHAEELHEVLAKFIHHARPAMVDLRHLDTSSGTPADRPPAPHGAESLQPVEFPWVPFAKVRRDEAAAIHEWALDKGIPMPHAGTPWSVLRAYRSDQAAQRVMSQRRWIAHRESDRGVSG